MIIFLCVSVHDSRETISSLPTIDLKCIGQRAGKETPFWWILESISERRKNTITPTICNTNVFHGLSSSVYHKQHTKNLRKSDLWKDIIFRMAYKIRKYPKIAMYLDISIIKMYFLCLYLSFGVWRILYDNIFYNGLWTGRHLEIQGGVQNGR